MSNQLPAIQLKRLALFQFKSYVSTELHFEQPVVCFLGNNGSGKTNLLDAIHYLAFCKSYFHASDSFNIRHGEDQAGITGEFVRGDHPEHISCALRRGQRKVFKRNHKEYEKLADHIGLLPAVIITPYDAELILDGSEVRRRFMDATISQHDRSYLDHLVQYNHALLQRNQLLKSWGSRGGYQSELLEPWDYRLIQHGIPIHQARKRFLDAFNPLFREIYHAVSGGLEQPSLEHQSDQDQEPLEILLVQCREKDRVLERTTCGIHRDELEFRLDGESLKKFASQGQQKSFLIALKLAQLLHLREQTGYHPMLMLDDLFDKLDEQRVHNLLKWIHERHHGQVFITDTHLSRIPDLLRHSGIHFQAFEVTPGQTKTIEF